MKYTLQVSGREMTFSEQELIAFVEEHFARIANEHENTEAAQGPTEGKWFEVNPQAINQELFQEERDDWRQEQTRQLILEAFAEMKSNPGKYCRPFKTMMPEKTWNFKTVAELKELASRLGDHNADWVEQTLEWAQRLLNGESWEAVCNEQDTANWYRLVVWKNGYVRLIGCSVNDIFKVPASYIDDDDYYASGRIYYAVPLVVLYSK